MAIQQYKTVIADEADSLDKKIAKLIQEGFQPYGSPYYCASTEGRKVSFPYCQAMVKPVLP
jgi:hypothetical protein